MEREILKKATAFFAQESHSFITKLCVTVIPVVLLALSVEVATRFLFPTINFVGESVILIEPNKYGHLSGYRPNAEGYSWGVQVSMDEFGFRKIPRTVRPPPGDRPSIVLLGDSVPFGVGIEAEEIFPSIMARELKDIEVYNTAKTSTGLDYYAGVVNHFVIPNAEQLRIKRTLLFYTLNDIHLKFNPRNDKHVKAVQTRKPKDSREKHPGVPEYRGLPWLAREVERYLGFNHFLIRHSKLYILVKGLLYDGSASWFRADLLAYDDKQRVDQALAQIVEMQRILDEKGIALTVFLIPYEYQLRTRDQALLRPQRVIAAGLTKAGIECHDLFDRVLQTMESEELSSKELFLFNDHAHLSPLGHSIVARRLLEVLENGK